MRARACSVLLLAASACEWIYSPDNLHPVFANPDGGVLPDAGSVPTDAGGPGTDGGGTKNDAGPAPDAGPPPDAGVVCFGPFDAGCSVLCLTDLTGSFTGAASLAAVRGPAPGFWSSSLGFALNRDAWVGFASDAGVVLTNHVTGTARITGLAVTEGHDYPGAGPCAEAAAAYTSGGEFFTSGFSVSDLCSNASLTIGTGTPSLGWSPALNGGAAGYISLGAGANTYYLFEADYPSAMFTTPQSVSLSPTVSDVTAVQALGEWLVTYNDGTASRWQGSWQSMVGTTFSLGLSAPTAGPASAQTLGVSAVIADFGPPGTLSMTLLVGTTPFTIAGPSGITAGTSLHITPWQILNGGTAVDGGTDIFRTTYLSKGVVNYTDWSVTSTQQHVVATVLQDACAPTDAIWAAAITPGMLLTVRGDGGAAITPMP